jgi:hypothetical protein
MAHIGEERRLGAVYLGQRLGAAPIRLLLPGIDDGRRELRGDEIEKSSIAVIERAPRRNPDDKQRDAGERALAPHGQHQRLRHRVAPKRARDGVNTPGQGHGLRLAAREHRRQGPRGTGIVQGERLGT